MFLRIETLPPTMLTGLRRTVSFDVNETPLLWKRFMPLLHTHPHRLGTDLFSAEVYPAGYFDDFDPAVRFEKWAAAKFTPDAPLPPGLETLRIPEGPYAVFLHRGPASGGVRTYHYIFQEWLPSSPFTTDDRPHFAIMGDRYRHDDPTSEEEIWIPVRPR